MAGHRCARFSGRALDFHADRRHPEHRENLPCQRGTVADPFEYAEELTEGREWLGLTLDEEQLVELKSTLSFIAAHPKSTAGLTRTDCPPDTVPSDTVPPDTVRPDDTRVAE